MFEYVIMLQSRQPLKVVFDYLTLEEYYNSWQDRQQAA